MANGLSEGDAVTMQPKWNAVLPIVGTILYWMPPQPRIIGPDSVPEGLYVARPPREPRPEGVW
eukprot:11175268-Lingulodinium_polyedra.AAC.1